jgi:predicted PurR-regulated permease PerM
VLFYFVRDRRLVTDGLRQFVPLADHETRLVFARVVDTVHATVFGALAVAAVQGFMGGLMFWVLGLPAPLLWGTVMAVLATIPVMGTFVIWAPAAVVLLLEGQWVRALILAAWGALAIGLIDNLLYPVLVGNRLRLHPLPVFFSIVGGIFLFGAAGVILGPLTLALADALLEIWRRRTSYGKTADADAPVERAA